MPTENENKKPSEELIDVGETVGAEIDLDDKGEPEKAEIVKEEEIEVEQEIGNLMVRRISTGDSVARFKTSLNER